MADGFKRHRHMIRDPWTPVRLPITGNHLQRWVTRAVVGRFWLLSIPVEEQW